MQTQHNHCNVFHAWVCKVMKVQRIDERGSKLCCKAKSNINDCACVAIPPFLFRQRYDKGADSLSCFVFCSVFIKLEVFLLAVLWVQSPVNMWFNRVKLYCAVYYHVHWFFFMYEDTHTSPTNSPRERERAREKVNVWMGVLVWVIRVCFSALSLNSPLAQCWKGWYWILTDMFPQVWEREMRAHAAQSALILLIRIHTYYQ